MSLTLIALLLLLTSAFFSGAESAFFSLTDADINRLKNKRIKLFLDTPGKLLTVILIWNLLVNFFFTVIITQKIYTLYPENTLRVVVLSTIVSAFFIMIFGEILPKIFSVKYNILCANISFPVLSFFVRITRFPAEICLNITDRLTDRMAGILNLMHTPVKDEEILTAMNHGELEEGEKTMIQKVIGLEDIPVSSVMIPRVNISAVPETLPVEDLNRLILSRKKSRYPVYHESLDKVTGILYVKDVLNDILNEGFNWKEKLRPAMFVPATMRVNDLLPEMQSKRVQLAIVLDEYGGTSGIVTLEDLIEEIFGEIYDEYDLAEKGIVRLNETTFLVDAGVSIDAVNEHLNLMIEPDESFNTLGGYIYTRMDKIPRVGETFRERNFRIRISEMERTRLKRVRITLDIQEFFIRPPSAATF